MYRKRGTQLYVSPEVENRMFDRLSGNKEANTWSLFFCSHEVEGEGRTESEERSFMYPLKWSHGWRQDTLHGCGTRITKDGANRLGDEFIIPDSESCRLLPRLSNVPDKRRNEISQLLDVTPSIKNAHRMHATVHLAIIGWQRASPAG